MTSELVADVRYDFYFFWLGEQGLVEDGVPDDAFTSTNSLVSAWLGGAVVMTGAKAGTAHVNFDLHQETDPASAATAPI